MESNVCMYAYVCACVLLVLCSCEARKTLVGRWTAAYKVPVPPIRKDSQGVMERLHKFTFARWAQKSKRHQTRTPSRSFPSFVLRDLRSAQVYINY